MVNGLSIMQETCVRRSPGGGLGYSLQYSCLEKPHGQRSLEGYSPWGPKEATTKQHTAQKVNEFLT